MKVSTVNDNKNEHALYLLCAGGLAVFFISTITYIALRTGFVSYDSWYYLRLAESVLTNGACHVRGEYFAVFPCGYSAMIAGLSWLTGMDVFHSSKVLNFLLLCGSGVLIFLATGSALFGFLFVVNPVVLSIGHYTWSENAFILSFSMIFYSLTKMYYGNYSLKIFSMLMLGLLIGVSTRYFFGPYAFLIFMASLMVYGKKVSIRAFPVFAVSGILFLLYYYYNNSMTGYGSGRPRVTPPESVIYLTVNFFEYLAKDFLVYFISVSPLLVMLVVFMYKKKKPISDFDCTPYLFLSLLGLGYISIAFVLRIYVHYDLYGTRTVGYGISFLLSSLLSMACMRYYVKVYSLVVMAFVGVLSTVLSHKDYYLTFLDENRGADWGQTYQEAISNYSSGLSISGAVVSFDVPRVKRYVAENIDIFYGENVVVLSPKAAPYNEKESYYDFKERVIDSGMECFYDFSRVNSQGDFKKIVDAKYALDIGEGALNNIVLDFRYSDSVRLHFKEVFDPGRVIPCDFASSR
ncbi:hypothetical protein SAMN05192555_101222 [Franzmannia pantelleriensis]|uniref:Dolichyl-phosphate-mannose-protein mannosyltransferase n=1 Tax=Franzmannia pantelleriensis TaxID=48727 RepID=A0A1G9ETM3_9GAMM|nr:hypothetical protein [Halomonas pantelleriensis]SDK79506.1 hypothetical protein SAMN05192555_101222 [Halomonas pantelleriensis]